ncbi:MAG TPA: hypothetical protein VFQ96_03385, partial [Microbacteriaceae bacterium]|nr:hypothetical protein [Microbacteriaceae bacterium]
LEDSALTAALGRAAPGEAPAVEVARQRGVLTGVLADIVSTFSPSIVVLGGFLTDVAPRDLDGYARRVCAEARPTVGRSLVVRLAELVENRLLYGAAEAAFDDQVLAAEVLERWCADL